jgi:hypothetical protein
MWTLEEFYRELQEREGLDPLPLVAPWAQLDTDAIIKTIRGAFANTHLRNTAVPIRPGSTNQSIGNQVASFVVTQLNPRLEAFRIDDCSGHGYPDKMLRQLASGRIFPFEVKATSQWNPSDSNRRVLTSSSTKLRDRFRDPISHLLVTILYRESADVYRVDGVRLDFLEPSTNVNIRLEASVNHKILHDGAHRNAIIR